MIRSEVQCLGFDLFEALEPGSLLFIDSSHTVKVGGDVNYLILEVLPRLRAGVLVRLGIILDREQDGMYRDCGYSMR